MTSEDREPPELFFLQFNGRKIAIELDKPFDTDGLGGARAVTLRVEPHRVFPYAGLRFHYPREYVFAADLEEADLSVWTLSGPDYTIMIQRFNNQRDHEALRDAIKGELIETYKGSDPRQSPVRLNVRGTVLTGTRIEARIFGALLQQDLYSFPSGNDSIVLILQDTPSDNILPSGDRTRTEKMLRATLVIPGN